MLSKKLVSSRSLSARQIRMVPKATSGTINAPQNEIDALKSKVDVFTSRVQDRAQYRHGEDG